MTAILTINKYGDVHIVTNSTQTDLCLNLLLANHETQAVNCPGLKTAIVPKFEQLTVIIP